LGRPKEAIVDTAEQWPADLIVMGSHGRHGVGRFLLGSVSLSVLSQAPCSVAIVKLPDGTAQDSRRAHERIKETAQS
jgi:nucleotide-binding universal stress UspA family protein